jgi:hypothetical protein
MSFAAAWMEDTAGQQNVHPKIQGGRCSMKRQAFVAMALVGVGETPTIGRMT